MTQKRLTISVLAKRAGVTVETIRFYQRRRLLAVPEKPLRGIRRYTEHDVRRVKFIKQSQRFGFSLDEIGELLNHEDQRLCGNVRDMLHRKLALIRERIEELRTVEKNLAALAERCCLNGTGTACPALFILLEGTLEADDDRHGDSSG